MPKIGRKGKMSKVLMRKRAASATILLLLLVSMTLATLPIAKANPLTIVLSEDEGQVGDKIYVSGESISPGGLIKIYWDSIKDWDGKAGFIGEVYAVGTAYSKRIVIPEATAGDHTVIVKDVESAVLESTTFTVKPKIVLDPKAGIVGDTITITGTGFGKELKVTFLIGTTSLTTSPITVTTDELGSFECTFDIPDLADGTYTVKATDTAIPANIATAVLNVGILIQLTPDKGIVGTTVTILGRGFTADGTVDIRWYLGVDVYVTLVDDYDIDSAGEFTTTFTVPLVPDPIAPGTKYTVKAIDNKLKEAEDEFTVVELASIKLDPKSGRPGDTFEVTGKWFTKDKKVNIYFDALLLGKVTADSVGSFVVTVIVPDVDPGAYTVRAEDEKGVSATATFTVKPPPEIVIMTRLTEYLQGDIISIYARCTDPQDAYLEIIDPNEVLFWSKEIRKADWTEINGWNVLPYSYVLVSQLPSDAPLGSWNFTAYKDISKKKVHDKNLFEVVERPTLQTILDHLDEVKAQLVGLIITEEEMEVLIETSLGPVIAGLEDVNATLVAIDGSVFTIQTDVGTIKVDVATIETDVSTIDGYFPVTVPAGPVWIAAVLSLIAALAAIASVYLISSRLAG